MVFCKWEVVKRLKKIDYVYISKYKKEDLVTNDYVEFINSFNIDKWNNDVFGELFKNFLTIKVKKFNIKKDTIDKPFPQIKLKVIRFPQINFKVILLNFIYSIINFFNFNIKNEKFFIIHSYLSFFTILNLKLKLKELPFFPKIINVQNVKTEWKLRDWKKYNGIFKKNKNKFLNILDFFIPICMPKSYLENYKNILKKSENAKWPKKPAFVFSSASLDDYDLFKIWLAEKKKLYNLKFVSFQHGGSLFQCKNHADEQHIKKISDYFLTWGYKENKKNSIYSFFRVYNQKNILPIKNGALLFANFTSYKYVNDFTSGYVGHPHNSYFQEKILFFKNLNDKIIKNTYIKHKPEFTEAKFLENKFYKNNFPNIKIENGHKNSFNKMLKKSRIFVTHVNQTSYLDTLSINFPTIIFFNFKYEEVRASAVPYLNKLKKAEILFDDPVQAAKKVNEVWNNVGLWWNKKKTQSAVKYFCNRYSKKSNELHNELYNFIKKKSS